MRLFYFLFLITFSSSQLIAGDLKTDDLIIIGRDGGRHEFLVEVAKTARERGRGLMFRQELKSNHGMLFLYEEERPRLMWMKNTFISLDMLFINKNGFITHIVERTTPFSLETISSNGSVLAVLELSAGASSLLKISVGDRIRYPAFTQHKP